MIFVDSGALIGRYLANDPYHSVAVRAWREVEGSQLLTTNHVLDEVVTLLARRAGYPFAAERAERIYFSSAFEIVCSGLEDEHEAVRYFRKFSDQRVSFTDCISFAVMKHHRLNTAFTFDRHFLNAGFRVIGLA
jgi:predicted nucleic acid-binding protein